MQEEFDCVFLKLKLEAYEVVSRYVLKIKSYLQTNNIFKVKASLYKV